MRQAFFVPGPPCGKGRPRVVQQEGRSQAYTPEKTKSYEWLVQMCYKAQCRAGMPATEKAVHAAGADARAAAEGKPHRAPSSAGKPSAGGATEKAVRISVVAVFPIPGSASRKRRRDMLEGRELPTKKPDADNILKIILDALNGLAYADDKQVVWAECQKNYGEQPGVLVAVEEIG